MKPIGQTIKIKDFVSHTINGAIYTNNAVILFLTVLLQGITERPNGDIF